MNEDGTGIRKREGKNVHELEVLYDDLSKFQVAEVDRTMPASPLLPRSMWTSHFDFFNLCDDIWRENNEYVLEVTMRPEGTM